MYLVKCFTVFCPREVRQYFWYSGLRLLYNATIMYGDDVDTIYYRLNDISRWSHYHFELSVLRRNKHDAVGKQCIVFTSLDSVLRNLPGSSSILF